MFRKLRFQTKIILAQNIVVLFAVLTIGSMFYQRSRNNIEKNVLEEFRILSDSVASQIDNHFYMMDKTALQIAANPDIIRLFIDSGSDSEYNYFINEPVTNSEAVRLLNSYNFKKDGFARICLYNDYRDFVYTATEVTTSSGIRNWFDSERFAEVQQYFENDENFVYYINPSDDILNDTDHTNNPYFSVIRQIKNYTTNDQACGYVEVQEFVRWIDRIVDGVGEDIYVTMIDEEGDIIYMDPLLTEDQKKEDIIGLTGKYQEEIKQDIPVNMSGYSVYRKNIENAPWQFVFVREKDSDVTIFAYYNRLMLSAIFFVLAIALATEIVLIRRLSQPLEDLVRSAGRVSMENPQFELDGTGHGNEIIRLKEVFNAMLSQMKQSMEREYASEANELKAQMFALQSQMNPHFLFNILAIISIEAQEYGNDKIPDMCTRLRRMMAYSTSIGNGYSTVREELDYVIDYMELMKVRYEEMFEYCVSCEDDLLKTRMPKYVIQPVCENCFKHSFKNSEPVWEIRVIIRRDEDHWIVEIHDNGIGFSEEYLEKFETMKKGLTFSQVKDKLEDSKIGGLGIPNIYMRLMFCYEDNFIFRLYNDAEGAVVLIGGMLDDQGSGG